MVEETAKKKLELIENTIKLDNAFDEIIARFFSTPHKQFILRSAIIKDLNISKKKEIIKSILLHYTSILSEQEIEDFKGSSIICIRIRNEVAHKLPSQQDEYNINFDGKDKPYAVNELLERFKKEWNKTVQPIRKILDKLREENLTGDVASVRVHIRNYKDWFCDIYAVIVENSAGEGIELNDYPDKEFNTEDYEDDVEEEIRSWLIAKGYKASDADIDVIQDWYEPDDS